MLIRIATPDPQPARALAALQAAQAQVMLWGRAAQAAPSPPAREMVGLMAEQARRRAAELALAARN